MPTLVKHLNQRTETLPMITAGAMVVIEVALFPASVVLLLVGGTLGALWRSFADGWDMARG